MVTVTYTSLSTLINDYGTPPEDIETIIDQAIDMLNIYNLSIPNLGGLTPGSKSVTLSSPQRGAVLAVAKAIFYGMYRDQTNASAQGLTSQPAPNDPETIAANYGKWLQSHSVLRI